MAKADVALNSRARLRAFHAGFGALATTRILPIRRGIAHRYLVALLLLASSLSGCMVGPNYHRPSLQETAQFKSEPSTQPATGPSTLPTQWWKLYNDAALTRL